MIDLGMCYLICAANFVKYDLHTDCRSSKKLVNYITLLKGKKYDFLVCIIQFSYSYM